MFILSQWKQKGRVEEVIFNNDKKNAILNKLSNFISEVKKERIKNNE